MNLGPEQRAHHEAGHAVVMHRLHLLIDYVQVGEEDECECKPLGPLDDDRLAQCLSGVMCYQFGGPFADRRNRVGDLRDSECSLVGWEVDMKIVYHYARMVEGQTGVDADQVVRTERERAEAFVCADWPAVQAVAAELLIHGRLPGPDVHGIIAASLGG